MKSYKKLEKTCEYLVVSKKSSTFTRFSRKTLILCENTLNYTMKKTILLLGCTLLFASSVFSANLNVYASGLKVTGITDDRKLSISYFLNAPADVVIFQLLDAGNPGAAPIYEVALDGKAKGENTVTLDLLDKIDTNLSGNFTWAIKATSNTANTEVTLVGGGSSSDRRFNFYTPAGLAVDNNPNSPYFGRIYVTESREDVSTVSGRQVQQGVYIYGADLSDITNQGLNPYVGGVSWNTSNEDSDSDGNKDSMYGPARITIDDDGYVYICDNGPSKDNTSGVWRMDPANPSANFVDVLHSSENRGKLYQRINSAAIVQENGRKYLYAVDNTCLNNSVANLLKVPVDATAEVQGNEKTTMSLTGIVNAHNTIVKGAYDDLWVFQYRNGVTATGVLHINQNGEIDLNQGLLYNRRGSGAISPDGNWFAYCGYENASIRIIPITYNNKKPSVGFGSEQEKQIVLVRNSKGENFVDGIAFDVAGNLYFASATTEWFYAYALPKAENTHTTVAPNNQKIVLKQISPRIRMMAYNLRLTVADEKYNFSFYANSKPLTGNILIYSDKEMTNNVHTVALSNLNQGNNNVSVGMDILSKYVNGGDFYWAVELTGEPNYLFGKVHENNMVLNRAHAAIDNSPESDFFGRVYVENRVEKTKKSELFVFEYDHSTLVYQGLCGMDKFVMSARPAVDDKGNVYWADWGDDSHGGVYITDPHDLNKSTSFFQGNVEASGLWTNNGVGVGSSSCGVYFYGTGANAKLFVLNEDEYDNAGTSQDLHKYGYCVYNVGQGDGSVLKTWDEAPSLGVQVMDNAGQVFSIIGTSHGAFLCQNRIEGQNIENNYSLQFYDNAGVRQYVSDSKSLIINGSFGGGAAVSPDEKRLFMVNGNGNILVFDIEWNGDAPGLTHYRTYETEYGAITTMHFDYAGNLVVMAGHQYGQHPTEGAENDMRLVIYTLPKDDNTIIVPAPSSQRIPALVLDEKRDNSTSLEDAKGEQMSTVRVLRSLTAGMYNTLCLPFDASLTEGPLAGAKAYTFSGSSNTEGGDILLHFSEAATIVAGVPYLIEPQVDIQGPIDFTNVTIAVSEGGNTGSGDITFNGILSPKELKEGVKSILFLVSDNKLAWANTTANMNGMRAYFSLPNGAYDQLRTSARIVTSEAGTTDIHQTTTQANTQKIMQNGRLYIRKDGQIYTILGRKVK